MLVLLIIVLLLSIFVVSVTHYYISSDIVYEGGIFETDCNDIADTLRVCPAPLRLVDNVTLEGEKFDCTKFIGWESDQVLLAFRFPDALITRVDIYFYNNPSEGYGIPPLKEGRYAFTAPVFDTEGVPVPVSFTDNSNFAQTDNESVTVISVAVASDFNESPYRFLRLTFDNSSTNINKTFISEVKLFSESGEGVPDFPPIQFSCQNQALAYGLDNNIPSSIKLSCTVINDGSFSITWTGPNGTIADNAKTRVLSADTSRTSILRISQVSLSDNGTYSCEASYTHFNALSVASSTSTITLTLKGKQKMTFKKMIITMIIIIHYNMCIAARESIVCDAKLVAFIIVYFLFLYTGSVSHPDTVQIDENDESVDLYCNFTGYLPSSLNVLWSDNDGLDIQDSTDGYNITTSMDGPGRSNIGGDTINSGVTSILTINSSDIGTRYTCAMEGTNIQGMIELVKRPPPQGTVYLLITWLKCFCTVDA